MTIVFTDIVDSTLVLARLGDQAWLDVIRRHNAVIEEATAAHGGTVVETQGDGSMLAFSSARRAVACAQAIQHEIGARIRRRVAADPRPDRRSTPATRIQEADHFFGTTVHYAARVASQALGGEVLVSSLVRELVAGAPEHRLPREPRGRAEGPRWANTGSTRSLPALSGDIPEHWPMPVNVI